MNEQDLKKLRRAYQENIISGVISILFYLLIIVADFHMLYTGSLSPMASVVALTTAIVITIFLIDTVTDVSDRYLVLKSIDNELKELA